jgi:class 3 adenylate cyclase
VNIASRVQEMAGASEICLTDAVWRYPGVEALLRPYPAEPATTAIPGLDQPLGVLRIGAGGR